METALWVLVWSLMAIMPVSLAVYAHRLRRDENPEPSIAVLLSSMVTVAILLAILETFTGG